jgi:Cys-rich repeat protein
VARTLCEVPCADDRDCPAGFFCQGYCQVGEAGLPDGFCRENI